MLKILKKEKPNSNKKSPVKPLNPKGVDIVTKPATATKSKPKKTVAKPVVKKAPIPKTASGATKDVMVDYNTSTYKWSVRTAGSAKALKSFETQKEAIDYGRMIAKNNNSELRIKSKEGKVRASANHRK